MRELDISEMESFREYLAEHFPGQALLERAVGVDTIVIEISDSRGLPKELRISRDFLFRYPKASIQEYLKNMKIAERIESVPWKLTIADLL
jgi:hypothetical protein